MAAPTGDIWKSLAFGSTPLFWLTVGGVPGVFCQKATGKTLPAGFTAFEDASLSLKDTGPLGVDQIDRDKGIACGLSFGFTLLDSTTVRDWMRKWSLSCTLTSALAYDEETSLPCDDNSAWPSSGALYVGKERIEYGSKSGTTSFQTLSRAASGTLADAYQTATINQVITDRPRSYVGREVRLYACFADPSGYIAGTALADISVEVWRGRVVDGPTRKTDGFAFEADSLDRLLDQKLVNPITGKVKPVGEYVDVSSEWQMEVTLQAVNASDTTVWGPHTVTIRPWEDGIIPADLARAQMIAAWHAAVDDAGWTSKFDTMAWNTGPGGLGCKILIKQDSNIHKVYHKTRIGFLAGGGTKIPATQTFFWQGMTGEGYADLGWYSPDPTAYTPYGFYSTASTEILIELDDGDTDDVPDSGFVRVKGSKRTVVYGYASKAVAAPYLLLQGCSPIPLATEKALTYWELGDSATAEIMFERYESWHTMMLWTLETSGNGWFGAPGPRGTYDVGHRGSGYGLPEDAIDVASFEDFVNSSSGPNFWGRVSPSGSSFADLFGGVLALFRLAVVAQPQFDLPGTPVKLQVVSTGGGGVTTETITSTDLLAHAGDPVESVQKAPGPTSIKIESDPPGQGEQKFGPIIVNDRIGTQDRGLVEVSYRIDTTDRETLRAKATLAAKSIMAYEGTVQAATLLVSPSTLARVGDMAWLSTDHPSLWTFTSDPGQLGYTGPARVLGRTLDPTTGKVRLGVLLDGGTWAGTLCPSMRVLSWTGASADAPTTITVDAKYGALLKAVVAAGAPFTLIYYTPGVAEDPQWTITFTGATGAVLAVNPGTSLDFPLTTSTYLTFPETAAASDYQKEYAHVGDGTLWGG